MKSHFIISSLIFSLLIASMSAQESKSSFLQQFSLEAGIGYHLPFLPDKNTSNGDLEGFGGFYIGANYAINDIWGVRLTYANNTFENKEDKSTKFTIHKVMAEGTFNILQAVQSQHKPFEIVAHSGLGVSAGKGTKISDTDKILSFQVGLMPLYRITKNFSINLDAIYVLNFRQNQGYDGQYVYDDIRDVIGSYLLLNIGLGVKFYF